MSIAAGYGNTTELQQQIRGLLNRVKALENANTLLNALLKAERSEGMSVHDLQKFNKLTAENEKLKKVVDAAVATRNPILKNNYLDRLETDQILDKAIDNYRNS